MVNLRSFEVPTVVKHAPGCGRVPGRSGQAEMGISRPMIVTDQGLVKAGIVDRVTRSTSWGQRRLSFVRPGGGKPPIKLVDDAAARYKQRSATSDRRPGGGSPMDTAKAIGVVAENGGSICQYEWADPQPIRAAHPSADYCATTAGTGSEVTLWSVTRIRIATLNITPVAPRHCGQDGVDRSPADARYARTHHRQHGPGCPDARDRVPTLPARTRSRGRTRWLYGIEDAGTMAAHRLRPGPQVEPVQGRDGRHARRHLPTGTESAGAVHAMSQTPRLLRLPHRCADRSHAAAASWRTTTWVSGQVRTPLRRPWASTSGA